MTDKTPHIRRIAPAGSLRQQLEMIVESDVVGDLAEQLEAFYQSRGHAGSRHQYTFMDILVTSAAAQLCGSDREAIRELDDPSMWERLRNAAAAAFPGDSSRRLSSRAPSCAQLYGARRNHFSGDALDVLKQGVRAAAVKAAVDLGAFDPSAGTWTDPDESQCVVGDATWIPVSGPHSEKGPKKRYLSAGDSGTGPRPAAGRELVVLSCHGSDGSEPIVLDADLGEGVGSGAGRNDADRAAAMLRRLLEEHGDTLRPGLRGLVYDTAMTSDTADQVLEMGVLPITKGPSTVIRLNRLDGEAGAGKRRTRALRAIPEGDADFDRLYGIREDVEAIFADIKRGAAGRLRGSRDIDFQIVVCQMLSIARAVAARHTHGKAA